MRSFKVNKVTSDRWESPNMSIPIPDRPHLHSPGRCTQRSVAIFKNRNGGSFVAETPNTHSGKNSPCTLGITVTFSGPPRIILKNKVTTSIPAPSFHPMVFSSSVKCKDNRNATMQQFRNLKLHKYTTAQTFFISFGGQG